MRLVLHTYPDDNLDQEATVIVVDSDLHEPFFCHQIVSAQLEQYSANYEYLLQVGADSDCKVRLRRGDRKGRFCDLQGSEYFKLFRSTWGEARIYLFRIGFDEEGHRSSDECVLCKSLWVTPPADVARYYNCMLYDMRFLPSFFLDDFRGQMRLNGFSFRWDAGNTDEYDFKFELRELYNIVRRIEPLFRQVFAMPITRIVSVRRKIAVGRVRDYTPSDYRRNCRKLPKEVRFADPRIRVFASTRESTNNLPAHRVMLTFLNKLKKRKEELKQLLQKRQDLLSAESELDQSMYGAKDHTYIGKESGRTAERVILAGAVEQEEYVGNVIERLLQNRFWLGVKEGASVLDVYPTAFYASAAYEHIYAEILFYEKKCFSMRAIREGRKQVCRLSDISATFVEGCLSRWQKKYSMVYEFWVYYRLHKAFLSAGYQLVTQESRAIDAGSSCAYLKGDLHVRMIHGIVARLKEYRQPNDDYWLEYIPGDRDSAKERTPDFVVIFTNVKTHHQDWIVLDAKSDDRMRQHMISKRQKYYKKVKHYKRAGYDCPESPSQSWIIYSGENEEGGVCRVECPPLHSKNIEPGVIDFDAGSTSYAFSPEKGIELADGNPRVEIHGNLHANIVGVEGNADPFYSFVSGETKTMSKKLGARLVY